MAYAAWNGKYRAWSILVLAFLDEGREREEFRRDRVRFAGGSLLIAHRSSFVAGHVAMDGERGRSRRKSCFRAWRGMINRTTDLRRRWRY